VRLEVSRVGEVGMELLTGALEENMFFGLISNSPGLNGQVGRLSESVQG